MMRHLLLASPPESEPEPSATNRHTLEKSLSIALGGILCVAIVYLVVFSLQHCIRYRRHHRSAANEEGNNATIAARSEQDEWNCLRQLELIPVLVCDSRSSDYSPSEACSICLAEYEDGGWVRVLVRCKHVFHKECIDRWLLTRSSFCPICRDRVIERAAEPTTTNCGGGSNHQIVEGGAVMLDVGMRSTQLLRALP